MKNNLVVTLLVLPLVLAACNSGGGGGGGGGGAGNGAGGIPEKLKFEKTQIRPLTTDQKLVIKAEWNAFSKMPSSDLLFDAHRKNDTIEQKQIRSETIAAMTGDEKQIFTRMQNDCAVQVVELSPELKEIPKAGDSFESKTDSSMSGAQCPVVVTGQIANKVYVQSFSEENSSMTVQGSMFSKTMVKDKEVAQATNILSQEFSMKFDSRMAGSKAATRTFAEISGTGTIQPAGGDTVKLTLRMKELDITNGKEPAIHETSSVMLIQKGDLVIEISRYTVSSNGKVTKEEISLNGKSATWGDLVELLGAPEKVLPQ